MFKHSHSKYKLHKIYVEPSVILLLIIDEYFSFLFINYSYGVFYNIYVKIYKKKSESTGDLNFRKNVYAIS